MLLAGCTPRATGVAAAPASDPLASGRPIVTGAVGHGTVAGAGDVPRRSPACFAPELDPLPEHVVVDGRPRALLGFAPTTAGSGPHDLVLAFHGRTNDAAQARRYFRLDHALPDAVVVYPQALRASPTSFAWRDPGDAPDDQRDFALVDAIVEAVGQARCIDLDRVFVVGHSLGAYFANDVACHLGGRVRAVASVAGGVLAPACAGGTAALLIHHPDDPLVPFGAGVTARDAFRAANGLDEVTATPVADADLTTLRCVAYGPGTPDPIVWCAHDDPRSPSGRHDPHAWPAAAPAAVAAFFGSLP